MFRHTDGPIGSGKNGSHRSAGWAASAAACLTVCLTGIALAQEAPPPSAEASPVRIQPIEASPSNRVELLAGRGVILNLSSNTTRAAIGDARIADVTVVSPRQVMISAKSVGTTNLILWHADDAQVVYDILVQPDLALLREAIAKTAPGSTVQVIPLGDKILLRGAVPDVDTLDRILQIAQTVSAGTSQATSGQGGGASGPVPEVRTGGSAAPPTGGAGQAVGIINHITIAGEHQVVLRCTVAEVSKAAIRQLGINGWLAGDNLHDVFAVNQIAGINPANIGAAPFNGIGGAHATPIPFATDVDGLVLSPNPELSLGFPRIQMQLFFKAMRENNLLRILAEPNLVALSGQEASFLAGGEFPYQITQPLGTTSLEWKQFGIRLRFAPTVIGRQMIRLRVAPEVSDLDFTNAVTLGGEVVPGIKSRRAETTIELASGSTIAIAGLLSDQVQATSQKIPGLGDVPVLGALFSSVQYQRSQTELVILVTPELVSSLQPDQVMPVPGQFSTDPNDFELFGLGMIEGKPAIEDDDPAAALETHAPTRYPKLSSPPDQMTLHGPWGPAEGAELAKR